MEHRLPEILEEAARVRQDLGYPILVSPFAQYIVTQAVLNVVQGERYKTIPDEVRKYAMGYYGRLAAQPSAEFLERAKIHPQDMVSSAPAQHLEPWLPRLRRQLGRAAGDEERAARGLLRTICSRRCARPSAPAVRTTTPLLELIRSSACAPTSATRASASPAPI